MVDFIFNILNLLVRVGLVIFLIRKYVVHRIRQSITHEKEVVNILDEQYGNLKDSCNAVESNLKTQEQLYHELQAKFALWDRAVAVELEQQKQKCVLQEKKMQAQIEKKQQYVQHRYIMEKELPGLLHDVRQTVRQEFQQDQTLGKSYITKVLRALHE